MLTFKTKGNKTVAVLNRKIVAYIQRFESGYAYCIGKPSDASCAQFSGNKEPFTELQCRQRLVTLFKAQCL